MNGFDFRFFNLLARTLGAFRLPPSLSLSSSSALMSCVVILTVRTAG